jgi:tRNA(Ile)-lysidine synthase
MLDVFKKQLPLLEGSPSRKKFLLAVSGGLDSAVMAELFRLAGYDFSIAHCNFQLRGKESDGDDKFVKKIAGKYEVPFFSVKFETEKFCTENNVSVQMGARQLRYDLLEGIREKNKLDYLVTAHHADDAIETFFINLLRGTGISGLHGIREKNGNIIRPMLQFSRKDIEAFAKENKLKWRNDSSNSTDKYERNKIRHHLLPALEEINADAKKAIQATIENLGRTEIVLNDAIDSIARKFIRTEGKRIYIHFNFFKELNPSSDYLFEVINKYGFNYNQCKQITECVKGQAGKRFLSESLCLTIDRENLIIDLLNKDEEEAVFEIEKNLKELFTKTSTYHFTTREKTKRFIIPAEPNVAVLDFDKLKFPLKIRKWKKGDRFQPLGMKHHKKISDFLVDSKVSMPDKDKVYVMISGSDIAWVIGYRTDERFKVTEATKKIYLCMSQKTIIP